MWKTEFGLAQMEAEKKAAAEKKILTSIKHSLQDSYDSNPPQNLVIKDQIPDNKDHCKAVIRFLTSEISKLQSEVDRKVTDLDGELEKLKALQRINGRPMSTLSTIPEGISEFYLKKEDDLEGIDREELKGYA